MGLLRSILFAGLLFWIIPSGLLAQSKDSTDAVLIQGLWIMDADVQMEQSAQYSRNSLNPLNEKHMERQLESMKSRTYVFHESGFFESSWSAYGDTKIVNGKWEIVKNGLVEINFEDQTVLTYSFVFRKEGLLLIPQSVDSEGNQPLYLKRIAI